MHTVSSRDDWLGAIAVIALLIGTATGNAYAMLSISVTAFVVLALFYRKQMGRGPILVAVAGAVTATVIGFVMAMQ